VRFRLASAGRWAPAVALAIAAAQATVLALRPRGGIIEPLEVSPDSYFDGREIARARRFVRPQLAIFAAGGASQAAVLFALVRRPGPLAMHARRSVEAAAVASGALSILLELATLPFSALARRRALAVGLATQSWRGWALDVAKGLAISVPVSGGAGALAVGLMRRYPQRWWLPVSGLIASGGAFFMFVAPVLLDPIFNDFKPLPEGETRDDVLSLSAAAAVDVRNVYEIDASRRTTAANAYVTGIGASRRVVLFDTLIRNFTRDETRLVVAHELAHVRHRDVARSLLALALVAPPATRAAALLTRRIDPGAEPGPQTLPAFALALGGVWMLIGLVSNQLSRAVEARADAFALRLTDAPQAFISFERSISLRNLADPDPPRWVSLLLGTHPSTVRRIGTALAYEQGAR
jgi:STE24 endopeptidase